MSLVHDALEKAKREASVKNAKGLGLPDARIGAGQPFRAVRRLSPVAIAALAAVATLAAVSGIWLFTRAAPHAGRLPVSAAPAPTEAAPARPLPPPPVAPAKANDPTPPPAALAPSVRTAAPPALPLEVVSPSPLASTPAPASTPAKGADASRTSSAASSAAASTPSFVRRVTLDDGTVVRLGGIAWSEEAPLAYLNGKLYGKGESVAGLLVERIERERVLLRGARGPVFLTLR